MENKDNAVILKNVTKEYPLYKKEKDILKALLSFGKTNVKTYRALNDISFKVKKGEIIGIVGLNGSGKSTLSALIAEISTPSSGSLQVNGTVAMLSAQAGLNSNLTGIQNIDYKCVLMGLAKSRINEIRNKIIEFVDIGEFINQPLKTYSSGMKARLGFAISVYMDPDILIIDEGLAVGDSSFNDKCFEKIEEFKQNNKTIFYVSHSLSTMKGFCDRIIWLHKGNLVTIGNSDELIEQYGYFSKYYNSLSKEKKSIYIPRLEKFEMKGIKVAHEEDDYCIEIDVQPKENCLFAFELFKDGEKQLKIPYGEQNTFRYTFSEKGQYRVKYYVRFEDKTVREFVEWPNKKTILNIE